jgi:hypothetical protein
MWLALHISRFASSYILASTNDIQMRHHIQQTMRTASRLRINAVVFQMNSSQGRSGFANHIALKCSAYKTTRPRLTSPFTLIPCPQP